MIFLSSDTTKLNILIDHSGKGLAVTHIDWRKDYIFVMHW